MINQVVQRQKSLSEQTYDALRGSILSGELLPGDRLIETQIASHLKVSRTPIREAIRQLQQEELVTADDNGWLRVTTISAREAEHLYDCRIALETLAVTEACQWVKPEQLHQFEYYLSQSDTLIKQKPSVDLGSQMLDLDYRFHRLIAESSGNICLLGLLDQVFSKMTLLRIRTTRHNPRVLDINTEHRRVYQAIAQQQPEQAIQAIREHLLASKSRVVDEVKAILAPS
ncbi:MAG: GntR family transcriptional regulator [Leptolyngbya sp. DLM2.Bin15]|nr:MAG: GntR family transcriptional regulator [Leptolyngbya sp. DLM2.Bin15]